ncbi:MAG: hypothetical protein AB1758_12640 [Candidatus Eremiobacterota bacterium]
MHTLLERHPELAFELVTRGMGSKTRWWVAIEPAISFIPEDRLGELAELALTRLHENPGDGEAAGVIERLSLEAPRVLHAHLDRIYELKPNWDSYTRPWPWRDSGKAHHAFLKGRMSRGDEDALELLLETRTYLPERSLPEIGYVGRWLYSDEVRHLVFPPGYLPPVPAPHLARLHPTWKLPALSSAPFGGPGQHVCKACGSTGHHLITLDDKRLEACLSCLGSEVERLSYRHGPDRVEPLYRGRPCKPDRCAPLKAVTVGLATTPRRWRWQDHAVSNGRENLHRVGGYPCWIQSADYPDCPGCSAPMPFLLQLDSDLPLEDGETLMFGDSGMLYGFFCTPCRISCFFYQCY